MLSSRITKQLQEKSTPLGGVLGKHLDDMMTYHGSVSLSDLLLMADIAAPTPGFHMLLKMLPPCAISTPYP